MNQGRAGAPDSLHTALWPGQRMAVRAASVPVLASGWWRAGLADVRQRWDALRREPDAGYSTEAVLVTALLVAAALVVVAIIVAKVTEAANGITLDVG